MKHVEYIYIKSLKEGVLEFQDGQFKAIRAKEADLDYTEEEEKKAIEELKTAPILYVK